MPEIEEIEGEEYCLGKPLKDEEGRTIGDCDKWINVGYKHKGSYAKVLSNLFPYEFEFREKKLKSIESFFQAIKFNDSAIQQLVFVYSGTDALIISFRPPQKHPHNKQNKRLYNKIKLTERLSLSDN